jgi:hypothetical protein
MADTSRSVYTVHRRLDVLESNVNEALQSAKSAHARLDVAPKVGPAGERGLKGDAGRDAVSIPGRNGKDSTVPGPAGRDGATIVGPAGRDGRNAPSIDELLATSRADMAALRAEYAEIKLMLQGFCDINKKAGDYITWLKQRAEARWKAKTQ